MIPPSQPGDAEKGGNVAGGGRQWRVPLKDSERNKLFFMSSFTAVFHGGRASELPPNPIV